MFSQAHVIAALERKRDALAHFDLRTSQALTRYGEALTWLATQHRQALEERLAPIARPGARPTVERVAGQPVVRPFQPQWENHQQARAWALDVLHGVPTMAADGSQITPSRDFSIPVGAVQVGWFENPHDAAAEYVKDIRFEVLTPEELEDEQQSERFPDTMVNLRRYEMECQVLIDYMRAHEGRQPAPVCFFDGSLVISFAAQMRPELQFAYLRATRTLIETSEHTRVPLVGYVDTSYATDLVSMLRWLIGDVDPPRSSDGALLRERMRWGERTEAFVCARDDRLCERLGADCDYYHRVHLVYLKTTAANDPSRLDLPAWLLESGELERVLDVVRAECIVGTGYPYAVETADALAVITAQDRERFYRTFQDFVQRLDLPLRYSRKAYSKRGRR